MNTLSENELLKSINNRFLSYFEKIKVEFPGNETTYKNIEWIKYTSNKGSSYDCIEIERPYSKSFNGKPIDILISLFPSNHPKKFKLSPKLSKILGFNYESRTKVVGALWQYIKSNKLFDSDQSGIGVEHSSQQNTTLICNFVSSYIFN
jgi:SWI/SNF-related matrix-associated actin-dependent regulator of chromatin subfamily D